MEIDLRLMKYLCSMTFILWINSIFDISFNLNILAVSSLRLSVKPPPKSG
jgi:hypothetical protein